MDLQTNDEVRRLLGKIKHLRAPVTEREGGAATRNTAGVTGFRHHTPVS